MWRISQWRSSHCDIIDPWESTSPIPRPYPTTATWRHIVVMTPCNHPTKKMGVQMHRTPSCVHLKWKYNIRLPPKERPSRTKATRLQVVNMSWWIKYLTGDFFESWNNQRATYHIYSGSWFFARFYCLHFHPLLWCLIWTFQIPYHDCGSIRLI